MTEEKPQKFGKYNVRLKTFRPGVSYIEMAVAYNTNFLDNIVTPDGDGYIVSKIREELKKIGIDVSDINKTGRIFKKTHMSTFEGYEIVVSANGHILVRATEKEDKLKTLFETIESTLPMLSSPESPLTYISDIDIDF